MGTFERSYAVNGLNKIGEGPGTLGMRRREAHLSIWGKRWMIDGGRLSVVEEDFKVAHA
jgi:hypothetical protein